MSAGPKDRAVVGQRVVRLPFLAGDGGASPTPRLHFTHATAGEVAPLLANHHYLGSTAGGRHSFAGWVDDELVAAMVFRWPTARMLPSDGTLLELSRWCLTPEAGKNAGSRMMRWVARWLRTNEAGVEALVSYSDPSVGHVGALYRASGWIDWPTHITTRWRADGIGYASGNGSWNGVERQAAKERWLFRLNPSRATLAPPVPQEDR